MVMFLHIQNYGIMSHKEQSIIPGIVSCVVDTLPLVEMWGCLVAG